MRRMLSLLMAILFVVSIPVSALAVEVDVSLGDVTIGDTNVQHTTTEGFKDEVHGGSVTVTGSSDTNTVTITAGSTEAPANVHVEIKTNEGGNTNVVLNDANIKSPQGAMEVTGSGDVVIELDGTNSLVSTNNGKAGLQVGPDSSITIQDANNDGGSLTAQGAAWGAGIGGNANDAHGDVTITGGTVVATGGDEAAGIGGGSGTTNGNITITGGNVTAQGAYGAAGIGSGSYGTYGGDAGDITISGGTVTATGGTGAAGIGGGRGGLVGDITITDGNVTANGGADYFETGGAGIGSGMSGIMGDLAINETEGTVTVSSNDITISGGEITATGGGKAADIGHGTGGNQNFPEEPVDIIISGDAVINTTGEDDAVIGAGDCSAEVTVDTSKLTPEGSINGVAGTYVEPTEPAPSAPASETKAVALPCVAADENGNALEWTKDLDEDRYVITIAGEEKSVAFSFHRWFLNSLKRQGAEKLVVKTAVGEIELSIQELLDMSGNKYVLTFDGGKVALTVDGEAKEI